nr:cyclic AMP-responsive element-binding protein 3-like protein 2 [Pogona vitticeps]
MEVLESGDPNLLHWDRKLSELSEPGDSDALLYNTHFTEFLDDFSQDVLGQLLNDPFLSDKNEMMEVELSPASPAPLIQAEHSYSLCGDSRPQSPLTHISADDNFNEADLENEDWCLGAELTSAPVKTETAAGEAPGLAPSVSLIATPSPDSLEGEQSQLQEDGMVKSLNHRTLPEIKLEPHEVDQFLNLSSKEAFFKLQGTGPLILTEEEKRTLIAEGYPIPTKLPLTKAEEKALKKIRRKIKNKISAQESRRKKKEYMDSLEKKVECCSNENSELRKKVEVLENTNRTLLQQLQRLQAMVAGKVSRSCKAASTQTGTCLMVVVLCFAITFGSFSQIYGPDSSVTKAVLPSQHSTPESYAASIVRSRSLLIYDGAPPLEEHHFLDSSSSSSSSWDRHLEPSKHPALSLESASRSPDDEVTEITIANETRLEKAVLVELQPHRVNSELEMNETLKFIEIDRRMNATS